MKRTLALSLLVFLSACTWVRAQDDTWTLRPNEVVAMLGGTNAVNMQNAGAFETLITAANVDAHPRFIDMGWEGDTVYRQGTVIERWRDEKYGDLANQLREKKATYVVLQFGQNEALDGVRKLADFVDAYEQLLTICKQEERRVTVVSPISFEKGEELQPDLSTRNGNLAEYVAAMKELTSQHDCKFVDLFSTLKDRKESLTTNGFHISPVHHQAVAEAIVFMKWNDEFEPLRVAVARKHRLWMNYWRPANWKCLYGDDGKREFGKATNGGLTLRQEWAKLPAMIAKAETEIWALAKALKE